MLPKLVEFEGLACVEGVLLALVADDALTVQGENQSLAGGACSERPVPFSWQVCLETVRPATGRFSSAKWRILPDCSFIAYTSIGALYKGTGE